MPGFPGVSRWLANTFLYIGVEAFVERDGSRIFWF
jgi:hypothetical protein